MRAVVFHGTRDVRVEDMPEPKIKEPTDVILKVTLAAICGSDLHLYGGFNPFMKKGDILGHEFMGEVVERGSAVKKLKVGSKAVVPFNIGCRVCFYCKNGLWSTCPHTNPNRKEAEKLFGHSPAGLYGYSHLFGGIPEGQAEFVRVINAEVNAYEIDKDIEDEKALFIGDIFSTGFMAAENALKVTPLNGTVAVFGAGPVGLFAVKSLFLLGAKKVIAIDKVSERLKAAEKAGAEVINFEKDDVMKVLNNRTDNEGPDAVIEAIGMEASAEGIKDLYDKAKQNVMLETDRPIALREAIMVCRNSGVVSIPGVFSGFADKIPMGAAFNKGLTFYMGQTHTQRYMDKLFKMIKQNKIDPTFLITHRIGIEDVPDFYKIFREKKDGCIKVVIKT